MKNHLSAGNTNFYPRKKKLQGGRPNSSLLLYWYNYIDLKDIKSSDIPVISGVVYHLGFCPKHAFMARINVREVGDTPTCRQSRQDGHSPTLGCPSLTLCTFAGHLGLHLDTETGQAVLLEQDTRPALG